MCDPFSAAAAGLGIASSLLGTVGSVNASRYQAAAADQSARAATQQAGFDASRQAVENSRRLAQQRAALAAAGIDSAGTPLDLGADLAEAGRLDERRILHEGALRANEGKTQALAARYAARVDLLEALTRAGSDLLAELGPTGAPRTNSTGVTAPMPSPRRFRP